MSSRRKVFWAIMAVFAIGLGRQVAAQPVFENNTPVGFSPSDSLTTNVFVTKQDINILVDLNEGANSTNPVIGNFQKVEKSVPFFSSGSTAGYMSQAIAVDDFGVIHRAWVQQRGTTDLTDDTTTPVYGVVYAKSINGGQSFSDTVSVSGALRFDALTTSLSMGGSFSTVDLVVNSIGNPRVVYAFDNSADGRNGGSGTAAGVYQFHGATRQFDNIFFNYSNDGGATWLPANDAVVVNDVVTTDAHRGGLKTAFPRAAVTSTDDIFIVYQADLGGADGTAHDIRLAKVDEDSLKGGTAQAVRIGKGGTVGSYGGVLVAPDGAATGDITTTPDIAVGNDDVLHIVYYNNTDDEVRHKTLPAEDWTDLSGFGWDPGTAGADVGGFDDDDADNKGLNLFNSTALTAHVGFSANARGAVHLFPTVVVDVARTPDRVYAFWKYTDATIGATTLANDENIAYAAFNYDGATGSAAAWGSRQFAFPTGTDGSGWQANGGGLFQNSSRYQIQDDWAYVDRVAAVVDQRIPFSRGDIHVVFSGGGSQSGAAPLTAGFTQATGGTGIAGNLYYTRFDGTEWELPQVLASARHTVSSATEIHEDGVLAQHRALFDPDLALVSGDDDNANVYLTFVGGSPAMTGTEIGARSNRSASGSGRTTQNTGRGFATLHTGDIAPLPYFKVIARVLSYNDVSQPIGGFQYLLTYNPVNPQTDFAFKNLITVTAGDNSDGAGIGGSQPATSTAPGGFLTGQWRQIGNFSLGVSSLNPGDAGAVFKGANSQAQGVNDNGVWEGRADDDGALGYAEWGDDGDKVGLLVKLNVLGSDSGNNLFVIGASSAAVMQANGGLAAEAASADSSSQSIVIDTTTAVSTVLQTSGFLKGITANGQVAATAVTAPLGSYFWVGANINIRDANVAPVVDVTDPDGNTIGSGAFANETVGIKYILFDSDDDVNAGNTSLQMELRAYPDNGLNNVLDIQTFGVLIVDEQDDATVTAAPAAGNGSGDFVEGSGGSNEQTYTWDDPGATLRALGFASLTKIPDGDYYIYVVADDQVNPPVFAVSGGALRVRHIPLIKSMAPVATDTVDTGEFTNLSITNPYTIKYTALDYDDDAQIRLFASLTSGLGATNVDTSGGRVFPNLDLKLTGATPIQLSDTLRTDQDTDFNFDVTAQGARKDSIIGQGNYFLYLVVADDDTVVVGQSSLPLAVRHSPAFEFTNPLTGEIDKINTTQQFNYSVEWQRGRSDQDLDGNAIIALYYIGTDPNVTNFSGRDSTALISAGATLISGGIREDEEGEEDQFVWDFRNPPGELPTVFRPPPQSAGVTNPQVYQVTESTDTSWVYAVLRDSLGNTRVEAGGAVLMLGSQETPASQAPRVTMLTPPSGGLQVDNGDVVRLTWDAFLIDDGTGTDDAYLRLYAAPAGKYDNLADLETHNRADSPPPGQQADVILINSVTGADSNATQITTLRESGEEFILWDTKTSSFAITGTPIDYDIFIAGSMDPQFGDDVTVNGIVDSIATGIGSQAQRAVLSRAPGALTVVGTPPTFSLELSPGNTTVSSGDTLDLEILVNSQGTSVNTMNIHLDVPRAYFRPLDQDSSLPGIQPFADSTGAFQGTSTIAQNDTTAGTTGSYHLNFVESVLPLPQLLGRNAAPFDSSQVAAKLQLVAERYSGGSSQATSVAWSSVAPRTSVFHVGTTQVATPTRDAKVTLVPRARLDVRVPLEGRLLTFADTVDAHLRLIGSVHDINDQDYIQVNDVTPVFSASSTARRASGTSVLEDSVQVVSDQFGDFELYEIPAGIYELTVKVPGYVSGRSDTLDLFDGLYVNIKPTFGSDLLGNLSPGSLPLALRGGDATGDNQIDIADANRIFALWNKTSADAEYVRDADINADGVINSLDLGFVSTNFGNEGFGAPPVFKRGVEPGDNSGAVVKVTGVEDVEAWWAGRVFEVTAEISGMSDVTAYGLKLTYDPERIKPLGAGQSVGQGDVFEKNPNGALFFHRVLPGQIDVTAGRIGKDWSASGDAQLVTVRFVTLGEDPGQIEIVAGELVNSNFAGVPMKVEKAQALPQVAALFPNYPNPFNPSTEIRFDIPTARDVQLQVYNQLGQTVRTLMDSRMKAGSYSLKWDGVTDSGRDVSSGVYFYSLEAGDYSKIRKMTLVK